MSRRLDTALGRVGNDPAQQGGYVSPPIYRGSTVLYPNVEAMRVSAGDPLKLRLPAYGRFGTPTGRNLEAAFCALEGGAGAVSTGTGLSAITTAILAFVGAGDHLLVTDSAYLPTRNFCDSLRRLGIETEYFPPTVGGDLARYLRPNTRLVFLESPGSFTMEVQDVPAITAVCRPRGVITLLDNTWATPVFFQPLRLGVDVVIHAATKYIIGHADSFLGVIVCTAETFPEVRRQSILLGQCGGPDDLHLALRGLRTLSVRLRHHQQQALALAQWLQERPQVAQVLYPALPGDPGHALWRRDFTGASGLLSVVLRAGTDTETVDAMIDSLQLFGLGHSWGGYESLIVPVDLAASRRSSLPVYPGPMLRIHVGLEDLDDLKADLSASLSHID